MHPDILARDHSEPPGVVLLGRRTAALRALESSDCRGILLTDATPPRSLPAAIVHARAIDPAASDWTTLARELSALCPIDAVVATTERMVLPAAQLRATLQLPGLGVEAATRCTDKAAMKRAITQAGLRCARFVTAEEQLSRRELIERLGLPMVLKTRVGSGGRGTRVARRPEQVPERLAPGWMAERFVAGTEMSIETLVHAAEPVFVNLTEYFEPGWSNIVPAAPDEAQRARLERLNREAIEALGIERGITHMEIFLNADEVWFGEMAARPPGGHLMDLIGLAYGFDPWVCTLQLERGHPVSLPRAAHACAGVRVFHPGPGIVRSVAGLDELRALQGLQRAVCRVAPGDRLVPRAGTGQEAAHVVFRAASRAEVANALMTAKDRLRIELDEGTAEPSMPR